MAASEDINRASGAAALIAGGNPFQWAQLGTSLLTQMDKPAGPSAATGFFGSSQTPFDSSGWTVNFGDKATQDTRSGDRTGSTLNPTNSGAPGGYATAAGPGATASGGISTNMLYIVGGVVLLLVLIKRKG